MNNAVEHTQPSDRPMKQKIVFSYPDEFQHKASNGVFGGVLANGGLYLEFFLERPRLIGHEIRTIRDGQIVINQSPDVLVERNVVSGLVVSEHTARLVHQWLGEQLRRLPKSTAEEGTSPVNGEPGESRALATHESESGDPHN